MTEIEMSNCNGKMVVSLAGHCDMIACNDKTMTRQDTKKAMISKWLSFQIK